jgi:SAM-dependent methyltransferase
MRRGVIYQGICLDSLGAEFSGKGCFVMKDFANAMILPALVRHHLKYKDDAEFYRMQAADAIEWLRRKQVPIGLETHALDLGCGHGVFGAELSQLGCKVTYSDESNYLLPNLHSAEFRRFNIDTESLSALGRYDLVICSNVLEHLSKPKKFLDEIQDVLNPSGFFYLSWTNWLSPWGGHEFSPFQYLGPKLGPLIFDKVTHRKRKHTPFRNLFPISIGWTLKELRRNPALKIVSAAPRYYPEAEIITSIPILREFLTWNCALLIQRR